MALPYFSSQELLDALSMSDAIDALEQTFRSSPSAPSRQHVPVEGGEMLLMPASSPAAVGVKLVGVAPDNPSKGLPLIHGVYVLFAAGTLEPKAIFDGAGLTQLRTAAVSGVATKHLARSDASRVVVFGTGVQGQAHVDAMRAVRPIEIVTMIDRDDTDHSAVSEADIVCTCTTSPEPVFDGSLLSAGVHVNAIGAYKPTTRELDDRAISAGRVFVETKAAALVEAGDLAIPIQDGVISADDISELSDAVTGRGRIGAGEITIFKSVGVAFEDLAVAAAAYERLG
jgi:ornithine cyclodeaminase/alanine dehydrogenase-like protein (mu-crystallin family)